MNADKLVKLITTIWLIVFFVLISSNFIHESVHAFGATNVSEICYFGIRENTMGWVFAGKYMLFGEFWPMIIQVPYVLLMAFGLSYLLLRDDIK